LVVEVATTARGLLNKARIRIENTTQVVWGLGGNTKNTQERDGEEEEERRREG
jgi:hypothetical protein